MIKLVGVEKTLGGQPVLQGIDLSIPVGKLTTIIGRSGEGKSVLLKHMIGLLQPDRGEVWVGDAEISRLSGTPLNNVRKQFAMLFQGAALFDSLSVFENVAYPLREHTSLGEAEIRERVVHSLSMVGLTPEVLALLPSELSGGMRKRVGIARALIGEPAMLLFDEPTAGLDPTNSRLVAELIVRLRGGVCDTAIVVTHDLELTRTVADRVAVLIDGQFAALGPRDEVLSSDHPAVQAFLAGEAR